MTVAKQKLLYVFDSGPHTISAGAETLEALLVAANFDKKISLLFIQNGVFQLKENQQAVGVETRLYTKIFKALADFDVTDLYVHDLSMLARGLTEQDLVVPVKCVTSEFIGDLIADHHKVFTF